jgi:hypothetical protein
VDVLGIAVFDIIRNIVLTIWPVCVLRVLVRGTIWGGSVGKNQTIDWRYVFCRTAGVTISDGPLWTFELASTGANKHSTNKHRQPQPNSHLGLLSLNRFYANKAPAGIIW